MGHALSHEIAGYQSVGGKHAKEGLLTKFIHFSERQEEYRLGWTAASIAGHGCVITPITLLAIILNGNQLYFWAAAMLAMAAVLVTNLAALPTKITVPTFLLSILIDVAIITGSFALG